MSNSVLDLIFPQKCLGCREWGAYLCSHCINLIKVDNLPLCPVCQKASFQGLTHPACQSKTSLDGLITIFRYQGLVKKALFKLKNKFVTSLANTLLELFLSFAGENRQFIEMVRNNNVCLVPLPIFWQQKNWQGFNQAELLGKMISQKLNINYLKDLLIYSQKSSFSHKTASVYQLNKKYFSFLKTKPLIMLFNDLWTKDQLMLKAGSLLKQKSATRVWGLTLARE